ncbi:MAG: prolyl oligopeptidase family serine peptidase [Myxococcota bacterium]
MPLRPVWRSSIALLLLVHSTACHETAAPPLDRCAQLLRDGPPSTRRDDVVDVVHGVRVPDPYRWLEPDDDPAVVAWADAQDAYARATLATPPDRAALREALRAKLDVDALSVPIVRGQRLFYARQTAGTEQPVWVVRDGEQGPERVLLDPRVLDPQGRTSIGRVVPSPDGLRVAYTRSRDGEDAATLYVRDVDTGRDRPDRIPGARYATPSWNADGRSFLYTALPDDPSIPPPERSRHATVRLHALGTPAADDRILYGPLDDTATFVGARVVDQGRTWVLAVQHGWSATDLYLRPAESPAERPAERHAERPAERPAERHATHPHERPATYPHERPADSGLWRPLMVGHDALASVDVIDGRAFVHTNAGAPRFRVIEIDPARPDPSHWRQVVPQQPDLLESAHVAGGRLLLQYLHRASSTLEIRALSGRRVTEIPLRGPASVDGLSVHPRHDAVYLRHSAMDRAPQVARVSMATGALSTWETIDVPVDPHLVLRQVDVRSRDGTPVSMFVLHRDDLRRDGNAPTLLTGYGGFGISLRPGFSAIAALWAERGGVWAVPNLRGGGEYGESWHEAGRRAHKQNTFDDFIAAAQYLKAQGYTRRQRLAIRGGSNGGLLVGAVSTQRPDLFGAVVCAVPLLDMIRFHRFGSGPTWVDEYGSPDDPEQFRWLWAYSPLHRIREGHDYPPLLMLSADHDDRVHPMHARKYVAAMQHASSAPALLRVERGAGHGGSPRLGDRLEAELDVLTFLLRHVGPG